MKNHKCVSDTKSGYYYVKYSMAGWCSYISLEDNVCVHVDPSFQQPANSFSSDTPNLFLIDFNIFTGHIMQLFNLFQILSCWQNTQIMIL